ELARQVEATMREMGGFDQTGTTAGPGANSLSFASTAQSIPTNALENWDSLLSSIGPMQITLTTEDLPGSQVGEARVTRVGYNGLPAAGTIVLDKDAAGMGWFVDPTPSNPSEYTQPPPSPSFQPTAPPSPAYGKYDLYSVVLHEMGHLLGFEPTLTPFASHVQTLPDSKIF